MKSKKLTITLLTTATLLSTATPFIASASSISTTNQTSQTTELNSTVYISNEQFLNTLKSQNPAAYSKIPETEKSAMLQQGTTKIVKTSTGFKIYLNSAIVKVIKYTGISAAAVMGVIGAAGITASTIGIGSAAFVGVGAAIGYIANQVNASRGIIVTFSTKGSLVSWTQQ